MGVAQTWAGRLRAKPPSYWIFGAIILVVTIVAQPVIDDRLRLDDLKNALFLLLTKSPTNPAYPHAVKLLPIGDDAFWGPEMAHRSPTNRAYLARVIEAADRAEASVVALDFDLRLADPTVPARPGDYGRIEPPYRAETDALVRAIGAVAGRRKVVLAKYLDGPEDGPFAVVPDAWGLYGLCTAMRPHGLWDNPGTAAFPLGPQARANIRCGYINLMTDTRRVPPPAVIIGKAERLDAFPLAIARAREPATVERFHDDHSYASYIPEAVLGSRAVVVPASALLADPAGAGATIQGYPVIIHAAWHLRARGAGDMVDMHPTPIGEVVGGLIHANMVEAVLGNRIYPAVSHTGLIVIEVVLGVASALLFALAPTTGIATLLLIAAMPVVLAVQWLSLQLLGLFLDLFAPVVGLGLHAILDRLAGFHGHPHPQPHVPAA